MRIGFLGDLENANTKHWLGFLSRVPGVEQISVWSLPMPDDRGRGRAARISAMVTTAPRVRRWVRELNPDLLIAFRTTAYGFLGAASGFHPYVLAQQGETDIWPLDGPLAALKRQMVRYAISHADMLHAWGENIADTLRSFDAPEDRLLVLPRGIDLELFRPRPRPPNDKLRMISTRSFYDYYRIHAIIDAVAELRARGVELQLDLVGSGETEPELREQVRRLGLEEQVVFRGRLPPPEVLELLCEADIYVGVPATDGVPMSVLEAMAVGAFPVVSDLPANRNWLAPDEGGFLVADVSGPSLADALERAWKDPDLRRRAAAKNRVIVEERGSVHRNMARFVEHYRELIAQQAGSPSR